MSDVREDAFKMKIQSMSMRVIDHICACVDRSQVFQMSNKCSTIKQSRCEASLGLFRGLKSVNSWLDGIRFLLMSATFMQLLVQPPSHQRQQDEGLLTTC